MNEQLAALQFDQEDDHEIIISQQVEVRQSRDEVTLLKTYWLSMKTSFKN